MVSILASLIMITALGVANSANVNRFGGKTPGGIYSNSKMSRATEEPLYLLISTSSKLYCMKVPSLNMPNHHYKQNQGYYDDLRNYEVIYEEKAHVNNWITDAFYVKSESLIYVNVYNSSSASSDIFTLKYEPEKSQWVKTILYKDQSYCLGIAYNEQRKELYWTAARSILAGSSYSGSSYRTLFNLDLAKKLLYLKYDPQSDSVYVSTLNYIYACSLRTNECKIVVRDLLSARGVYVDSLNRNLYVVDHKKRNIKRTRLVDESESIVEQPGDDYASALMAQNSVSTVLSSDSMPDIGDIFYMTVLAKSNVNMLVWSEFSGKIKMASLNDTSNYRVIFSTNEYTYSVNVMDNSTNVLQVTSTTTSTSTTTTSTTTTTEEIETTTTEEEDEELTTQTTEETTLESTTVSSEHEDTTVESAKEEPIQTQTSLGDKQLSSLDQQVEQDQTDESTSSTSTPVAVPGQSTSTEIIDENGDVLQAVDDHEIPREEAESESEVAEVDVDEPKTGVTESTTQEIESTTSSTPSDAEEPETTTKQFTFVQKLSENETADIAAEEVDPVITMSSASSSSSSSGSSNQIQNLRGVNLVKQPTVNENESSSGQESLQQQEQQQPSSSSSYNLIRTSSTASHQLNVALYIVICLLVFSLIINIILLYVSKMRQQSREKLIITHEICDKSETMPSQRSGLTAKMSSNSEELTECNINLINHNGSATSALDGEQ